MLRMALHATKCATKTNDFASYEALTAVEIQVLGLLGCDAV
jgi:hypothetical protein